MMELQDDLLAPRFAALAYPFDDSDWREVVGRARPEPWMRRHRRLAFAVALVVAAGVLVAAAFATGLADRFSAWVSGSPGRPAPAEVQRGFEQRNRAAYASFPAGTQLRLLLSRTAGGTTFSLLGFRNGDAYCLRLIRADHPNGIGRNECLRAEELSGVPALVAGDVWFSVGKPAKNINGVYGFASDDVRTVVIVRARGSERVPVVNNVFLSLNAQAAGSVQHHPLPNPVLAVHALLRNSSSRDVPYVSEGMGVVPGGKRLIVPSYFARPSPTQIPGPTKVVAPIAHPQIEWLLRREPRGKPLPPQRIMRVQFGRVIQPDPDDPIRIGVATGTIALPPGAPRPRNLQHRSICVIEFQPLALAAGSADCMPASFPNSPLALGSFLASPITHLNGFVADGITHVTAFLASGRVVQAALRDNVFAVAVSATELPGRIVGYDAHNRVAGIVDVPGNSVIKPCPKPTFTKPVSQLPAPKRWEKINLATLTVNGQHILGMTPQQVEVALGKPTVIRGNAQITNGVPIPEFRYGGSLPSTLGLSIGFSKKGVRIFANSLSYQSPSLVDAKLGHVLRMQPATLEQAIKRTYGTTLHVFLSYGSNPGLGCTAVLKELNAPSGISIGLNPYRPSRPYLIIRANAYG
jgi:hypothetical protein